MKYLFLLILIGGVWGAWTFYKKAELLFHPPKTETKSIPVKQPVLGPSSDFVKPDFKKGAPLDTPKLQDREMFTVPVYLGNCTQAEAILSLGSIGTEGLVVRPSPFGNSVVVSGVILQNVMSVVNQIKIFDAVPPPQVMIQAVILRTTSGRASDVGVWHSLQDVAASGGLGLDSLSWNAVTGIVSFGSINGARDVMKILASQNVEHYGFKVESRPILATVSGQKAWFSSGREIPVPVTTQTVGNAQTSITYKKVVFSLGVLPTIMPDGSIALNIDQTNDDVLASTTISGNAVPTVATQSLTTRVKLREGEVAVIGGIAVDNASDDRNGFPVLGHIPVFSFIFGNRQKKNDKSELLIVITAFSVPAGSNPLPVRKAVPVKKLFSQPEKNARGVSSHCQVKKKGK